MQFQKQNSLISIMSNSKIDEGQKKMIKSRPFNLYKACRMFRSAIKTTLTSTSLKLTKL